MGAHRQSESGLSQHRITLVSPHPTPRKNTALQAQLRSLHTTHPTMADEENWNEEQDSSTTDWGSQIKPRESELRGMLQRSDIQGAFKASLSDPPYDCKDQKLKDTYSEAVGDVLKEIKEAEFEKYISPLSSEEMDVLMKFIYRALALGISSGHMLKWHAALTEKAGLGCIVRVMAERK